MDQIVSVRAKAWRDQGVQSVRCMVSSDGLVRVYDEVAGYYTLVHSLSESAQRRIRRLAAQA